MCREGPTAPMVERYRMPLMDEHALRTEPADALLDGLTDAQRDAVTHTEGPLLVLAAAGSGKTRVITRRIAYLVQSGIPPWSILALTFTNKASGEMRERVHALLGDDPRLTRGLTVTTFHALCARLLRRHAEVADLPGLRPDFAIYPTADQTALVKRVIKELDLSTSNWSPRSVLSAISNAKNELIDAERYRAEARDYYSSTVAKIYTGYTTAMRQAGAVDFDDLLLLTAKMLREKDEIREECDRRWQYMLIDEYQDTNHAQFLIASLIAGTGGTDLTAGLPGVDGDEPDADAAPNVCVVGDPDQSIYGWRGADITNILEFEEQYPGARVIALGQNFRSDAPILAVADSLIRNNRRRKHKDLFTTRKGGEPVLTTRCKNEQHEAQIVGDWFRSLHDEGGHGINWKDMAVFYRTNALSRVIEDELRGAGIPYVIARGTAFYEREEVRHVLSYLRLIGNLSDDVSLGRIVNVPSRGIGKTSLSKIETFASRSEMPVFGAMRRVSEVEGLTARSQSAMTKFVEMIDGWTGSGSFMGETVSVALSELVQRVIQDSGLESMYKKQAHTSGAESDLERLGNLDEMVTSAAQFEDQYRPEDDPAEFPGADAMRDGAPAVMPPLLAMLRAYLESVALVSDADKVDPSQGTVMLMTLHAAKGLEFPVVAMIGMEEGTLPHSRSAESESQLEEERRLCFVGVTRAMKLLKLTSAKYRSVRGVPERTIESRFIEELGAEHVQRTDLSDDWDDFDQTDDAPRAARPRHDMPTGTLGQIDTTPTSLNASAPSVGFDFPVGSLVRHPQFGPGKVLSVSRGRYARARVKFRDAGEKTLILEYARLTRIG